MTTKQPTTLDRVIVMQKLFADLYKNSWVISIHSEDVLIREGYLAEVAPLTDWALNTLRNDPIFPYEHSVTVRGVKFIAITNDPINHPQPAGETLAQAFERDHAGRPAETDNER